MITVKYEQQHYRSHTKIYLNLIPFIKEKEKTRVIILNFNFIDVLSHFIKG